MQDCNMVRAADRFRPAWVHARHRRDSFRPAWVHARHRRVAVLTLVLLVVGIAARADIVPPINLQIKEADEGSVQVQWKVPSQLPSNATPVPFLPSQCVSNNDSESVELPAGRLFTESFHCERSLGGEEVGIDYPFYNTTFSTLARVELRSGEQFVHVLEPGNERWKLPLGTTGLRQDPWTNLKLAVVAGIDHFFSNWFHPGFLLVICLVAARREALGLATAFSTGQLAAVLIGFWSGLALQAPLAEVGPLLAMVLLAAQALRSPDERTRSAVLVGAAGVLHGLGLGAMASIPISFAEVEWLFQALMILGMDAVLVAGCALVSPLLLLLVKTSSGRRATRALKYALGGVGLATALGLAVLHPVTEIEAQEKNASLPGLSMGSGSAASVGSRALAPQGTGAPLQLFVSIAPFETRLETMIRLDDVLDRLDLDPDGVLPIESQDRAKAALLEMVQQSVILSIDGAVREPVVDRVDFVEVGTKGVLPRTEAIPEQVSRAHLGVTLSYLSETIPDEVRVEWSDPGYDWTSIPLTVTDPESTRSLELT
ncbi:MAG: HupE/UreJ family protein, partial [Acidobacteriota bacterium]